ncbi:MAG: DUF418 domain-containing protein [Chromatiales bacterium]|jgi:uncharacterized protein|nr:MAG: DUF418 domain-containing protein [Chromatiales bacterium]
MSSETGSVVPAIGPVPRQERLQALDIARGVAVLGILLMNIWAFAGPEAFFDYPLAIADRPGNPVATWAVVHTLFEGTQRALLSLLFGVGAMLSLARLEKRGAPGSARGTYYRRTFALIALGLINAYVFLWPADILFVYGLAGLCLYPLRKLRTPVLLAIVLIAVTVPAAIRVAKIVDLRALESASTAAVASQAAGVELSKLERSSIADWDKELKKARPDPADDEVADGIRSMQSGSLAEIIVRQAKVSLVLQTIVAVKWWFLDALGMMIIGMVLYRSGILTRPAPRRRYLAMIGAGFAIGLPLAVWQTNTVLAAGFHPLAVEITNLGIDVRRFALAMGYLGLILWFCQAANGQAIKRSLAAVGRMALTNYLAQSILCGLIFYGFGFGLYGRVTGYQLYGVVLLVWGLELLWSTWWLKHFRIGPFEWVWRSVTYQRAQAWQRAPSAETGIPASRSSAASRSPP